MLELFKKNPRHSMMNSDKFLFYRDEVSGSAWIVRIFDIIWCFIIHIAVKREYHPIYQRDKNKGVA